MNKAVLHIALSIALVTPIGCRARMTVPSSSFLSAFSLEQLVKNNHSFSGMMCAKGGLGGDGNRIGSAGRNGSSTTASSSFSCHLSDTDANSFDEAAFIASLKTDTERQIRDSGATISSRGSSDPTGFFIEYAERDIHGRITIDGKTTSGGYFSLHANINEKTGNTSSPGAT